MRKEKRIEDAEWGRTHSDRRSLHTTNEKTNAAKGSKKWSGEFTETDEKEILSQQQQQGEKETERLEVDPVKIERMELLAALGKRCSYSNHTKFHILNTNSRTLIILNFIFLILIVVL